MYLLLHFFVIDVFLYMYLLLHFFVIDVFLYIVSIFREGSVYVDFLIGFITELTADDVQQTTVILVQTVQANPTSPLDKIKSINTDDIHVTIYKGNSIHLNHPTVKSLLISVYCRNHEHWCH